MHTPLSIIYRDEHIVAINKPSGLLVHRSNIDRHETRFALQLLRDQIDQHVFPVHRLDKPTSGVLLFALSSEIAQKISEQFASQNIDKRYLAIVRGYCPKHISVDHALKPIYDKMNGRQPRKDKPAQEAITHFKQLACVELPIMVDRYPQSRYSLVEAKPETGRKHQIRRHLKHIAHPIIGDPKYGKSTHNRFFSEQLGVAGLLLHSHRLGFKHPVTDENISITADTDERFDRLMKKFGWEI